MMYQSIQYKLFFALIVALMLSLAPFFFLLNHNDWGSILDKIILFSTAFFITLANIQFQQWVQQQSYSVRSIILCTILLNLGLLGLDVWARISFWKLLQSERLPILILFLVDCTRSLMIAVVSYFAITFMKAQRQQYENRMIINMLENETLQLQLKGLTAQLQPHFFFNSLNVLAELIQTDVQKSDEYIRYLSRFFRYMLSNQQEPMVSLVEELNFIDAYLYLLKIRFGENLQIESKVLDTELFMIPSLCTLIVLENIVKHNNISQMKIMIELDSELQMLQIGNTICPKNNFDTIQSLGYGLDNINKKCELLLQRNIKITANDIFFEVGIPLRKQSDF